MPKTKGITPSYEQKVFAPAQRKGQLRAVVTPDGRDGTLRIHQDVEIALGLLDKGNELRKVLAPGRHAWVQCLSGQFNINGQTLVTGDAAAVSGEKELVFTGTEPAEVMVFDLA